METATTLEYELAPESSGSNVFVARFNGKPLAGASVTVVTPTKWQKSFKTDAQGRLDVPVAEKGRYVLVSSHDVEAERTVAGQKVSHLSYVSTLSFVAN